MKSTRRPMSTMHMNGERPSFARATSISHQQHDDTNQLSNHGHVEPISHVFELPPKIASTTFCPPNIITYYQLRSFLVPPFDIGLVLALNESFQYTERGIPKNLIIFQTMATKIMIVASKTEICAFSADSFMANQAKKCIEIIVFSSSRMLSYL